MAVTPLASSSETLHTAPGGAPQSVRRTSPIRLECRSCGYEADDPFVPPTVCPKCHGSTWERSPRRRVAGDRPTK